MTKDTRTVLVPIEPTQERLMAGTLAGIDQHYKVARYMSGDPNNLLDASGTVTAAIYKAMVTFEEPVEQHQPMLADVARKIDDGDIGGATETFNAGMKFKPASEKWRAKLEVIGAYKNRCMAVPSSGVIEIVEDLRSTEDALAAVQHALTKANRCLQDSNNELLKVSARIAAVATAPEPDDATEATPMSIEMAIEYWKRKALVAQRDLAKTEALRIELAAAQRALEDEKSRVEYVQDCLREAQAKSAMNRERAEQAERERDESKETIWLAHEHMKLYLPHYKAGHNVYDALEAHRAPAENATDKREGKS